MVEQETGQWIAEFNNSLQDLQRRIKEQETTISAERKKGKTGAIQVKLKNAAEFTRGWKLVIGDGPEVLSTGDTAAIDGLSPARHLVQVMDVDKKAQVSFMVEVSADKTTELEIDLRMPGKQNGRSASAR